MTQKVRTLLTFFDVDGVKRDTSPISTLTDDTFSPANVVKSDARGTRKSAILSAMRVDDVKRAADGTFYIIDGQKSEDHPHFL
jgi:hypothetical protein